MMECCETHALIKRIEEAQAWTPPRWAVEENLDDDA